uniref:Uncharacterized protein n=1 Tax=Myotis myotis TaxID=51298 RepID=A0A7J7VI52_MYOMY|nr:hypothetical protein mMyoMyo1_008265 [Myotis myotis]
MHRAGPIGVGALPRVTHRAGPIRGVGAPYPVTHTEQGGSGGWGATPCHTQGRADGEVMALSRHTQSRARGGQLGRCPLSPTEQGPSWGLGLRTLSHSRADQGVGEHPPIRHRAGPIRGLGCLPLSQTAGRIGRLWPHSLSQAAGRIGRLWPHSLSHTEPQGDQGVWALPPVTLLQGPGGLAAPLIPVLGGILPFYYIG